MQLEEKVMTRIQQSIETRIHFAETLSPLLVEASTLMTQTFINDGKLLLCGNGTAGINAQLMASLLINQNEHERPGLPAIALNNSLSITGIQRDYGLGDVYSRQIRALGQANDCLLLFTCRGNSSNLVNAVQAAHDRGIPTIVLSGNDGGHLSKLLDSGDLEIRLAEQACSLIHEIHSMLTYLLCELVEEQLFGGL